MDIMKIEDAIKQTTDYLDNEVRDIIEEINKEINSVSLNGKNGFVLECCARQYILNKLKDAGYFVKKFDHIVHGVRYVIAWGDGVTDDSTSMIMRKFIKKADCERQGD